MPSFGIQGPIDVDYYQITPLGAQRLQAGNFRGQDFTTVHLLKTLANLGGAADFDELKIAETLSPVACKTALANCIDLGWCLPAQAGAPQGT